MHLSGGESGEIFADETYKEQHSWLEARARDRVEEVRLTEGRTEKAAHGREGTCVNGLGREVDVIRGVEEQLGEPR